MQKLIRRQSVKKGFTLIELSLSIAFIGILSITVALIINNAIMSYRRGLTLSQINTAGMDVIDDMRLAIQNSPTKSVNEQCGNLYSGAIVEQSSPAGGSSENDLPQSDLGQCDSSNGSGFVSAKAYGDFGNNINVPLYGVFCTGAYSYVWNSGYYYSDEFSGENEPRLSLRITDTSYEFKNFRLLKIRDTNRAVCTAAIGGYNEKYSPDLSYLKYNNNEILIPKGSIVISEDEKPYDLLSSEYKKGDEGENTDTNGNLAIYDLVSTTPVGNDSIHSLLYSVSFILGTPRSGISINATGDFCKPPEGYDNSFNYCAINKFNFAAQATGG